MLINLKEISLESNVVLIIVLALVLFFANTSEEQIIKGLSNAITSIVFSITIIIIWIIFNKR